MKSLYELVCEKLKSAPEEQECSAEENEVYADLANLKESLERLGLN